MKLEPTWTGLTLCVTHLTDVVCRFSLHATGLPQSVVARPTFQYTSSVYNTHINLNKVLVFLSTKIISNNLAIRSQIWIQKRKKIILHYVITCIYICTCIFACIWWWPMHAYMMMNYFLCILSIFVLIMVSVRYRRRF